MLSHRHAPSIRLVSPSTPHRAPRAGLTRRLLAGAALTLTLALAACAAPAPSPAAPPRSPADGLVLAVGDVAQGEFDPLKGWGTRPDQIRALHSTLLRADADLNMVGDLATDFGVTPDGLTWTFTLRDARWSTGEPVTAADVAFTYQLLKDDGARFDLSFLDAITVADDHHISLHLAQPRSTFVGQLAEIPIVPKDHYGPDYSAHPIGSGPYRAVDHEDGQQLLLEANPNWYGEPVQYRRLTFLFLKPDAALAAARAGSVDVAYLPPAYGDAAIDGMKVLSYPTVDARGLTLPTTPAGGTGKIRGKDVAVGNDVTSDPAIRRALTIGLDRRGVVAAALQGHGAPAYSLADGTPWANPAATFPDGRIEDARALISAAGWGDPDHDGVLRKDGRRASFELLYSADDPLRSDIALVAAEQARPLGIEIVPRGASWDGIYLDGKTRAVVWGGGRHHAHQLYEMYASGALDTSYNNMAQYSDPAVDGHIRAALAATTPQDANREWSLAQWDGEHGVVGERGDNPIVWLARLDHLYVVRDGVDLGRQPLQAHGEWAIMSNIAEWRWNG